jgi:hypothetical protein
MSIDFRRDDYFLPAAGGGAHVVLTCSGWSSPVPPRLSGSAASGPARTATWRTLPTGPSPRSRSGVLPEDDFTARSPYSRQNHNRRPTLEMRAKLGKVSQGRRDQRRKEAELPEVACSHWGSQWRPAQLNEGRPEWTLPALVRQAGGRPYGSGGLCKKLVIAGSKPACLEVDFQTAPSRPLADFARQPGRQSLACLARKRRRAARPRTFPSKGSWPSLRHSAKRDSSSSDMTPRVSSVPAYQTRTDPPRLQACRAVS